MSKSKTQDDASKIVVIGGKKMTISDVRKSFAELEFLSKSGASKVINVLSNAKEPLSREQIAVEAHLSTGYTIDMLNRLVTYDYATCFRIGKRKTLYYALTEQGYNVLVSKKSEVEQSKKTS